MLRGWGRRGRLAASVASAVTASTLADGALPFSAGRLVDAPTLPDRGLARVQRLSTERRVDSFAGSTVRKISRGMWALDELNDLLVLSSLPGFVLLVDTTTVLGARWPAMGGVGDPAETA